MESGYSCSPRSRSRQTQLRTLWSFLAKEKTKAWGWDDLHFEPATLQSEFCIVRGGSDDDKPILERIAAELLRASESLAREELGMNGQYAGASGYLPVIVTNARLVACYVALVKVDLEKGELPSSARFEEVGAIRFRKALPSDLAHPPESYTSIQESLNANERSVFVVNVGHLTEWLKAVREILQRSSTVPWKHME